jgi:tetratricopeptide (TPR) repeat protein
LKRVGLGSLRVKSPDSEADNIVNHLQKSRFSTDARTSHRLRAALIPITALFSFAIPTALAQQATSRHATGAIIQGSINDSAGKPIANASVRLDRTAARNPIETKTTAAGVFEFSALPSGTYTLTAEKSGRRSAAAAVVVGSDGDRKRIDLVLESDGAAQSSSPAQPMGFSDSPNFTVAGITDWTAVGGHGSDSILRTSEDLARETLALKPKDAEPGASDRTGSTKEGSESESALRTALAGAPGSFAANQQLGEYYLHAGRYSEALPLLEAAYRLDPANDSNERDLALAYEETGDPKQAREHVDNLLKRKNDADLHRMAAELDEKLGDPLGAVQEYQRAVTLDPNEQNYFAWGSELLLHRAVWQAADVFRAGVKAHPNSARLLTGLGTALFAGAAYDEAARSFCSASELDPSNPEPYIFMGKVAMAAPTPLPCIDAKLARFAKENPNSSIANYLYAMSIWKQQQSSSGNPAVQDVEALLTKAVTIDPRCSDGFLQLGILAASQRNYDKAIQLYTKASEINPELAEAHYRLGVAYEHINERDKAEQEFQLHDQIEKQQADAVERERREVKQFVVVQGQPAVPVPQ